MKWLLAMACISGMQWIWINHRNHNQCLQPELVMQEKTIWETQLLTCVNLVSVNFGSEFFCWEIWLWKIAVNTENRYPRMSLLCVDQPSTTCPWKSVPNHNFSLFSAITVWVDMHNKNTCKEWKISSSVYVQGYELPIIFVDQRSVFKSFAYLDNLVWEFGVSG